MIEYTTYNGTVFTIKQVENIKVFSQKLNHIVEPKPPKYLIKNTPTGPVYGDNTMHPKYAEAIQLYNARVGIEEKKGALLLCVQVDTDILEELRALPANKMLAKPDSLLWYEHILRNTNQADITNIINQCFLTENAVYDIFNVLAQNVYRGRTKILDAKLVNGLQNRVQIMSLSFGDIQLVHPVDEFNCAIEAGFSISEWRSLSRSDQIECLALFRLSRIIENHVQDDAQEQSKKKNK